MGSWITLIGSIVIGSLILLSVQQFSQEVSRDIYADTLDNIAYSNLDELKRIIEYDFSRIGLGVNDPSQAVLTNATATDITFRMDSDSNGVLETMRYYLSTTTDAAAAATPNPNDKALYRVVNGGTPAIVSTGLTDFKIQYYNSAGSETTNLSSIRTLVVSLTLESNYASFASSNEYPKLIWHQRFTPPSLVVY
ncbi:MAG: hypothetical protein ONB46_05370 [candidate division KSB1 bacterium]|nr:hypothetical protein [candidate division KSB1 bacterium]MDZ7365464.1 hypothetical protein [candidate division KSB1 bacterium]MDZ7403489.1 hypothetical protein [candidate division KSB1 bacterium]